MVTFAAVSAFAIHVGLLVWAAFGFAVMLSFQLRTAEQERLCPLAHAPP